MHNLIHYTTKFYIFKYPKLFPRKEVFYSAKKKIKRADRKRIRSFKISFTRVEYLKGSIDDQKTGIKIVYKALEVPFLSICENAGLEGKVILKELEKREYKQGYDVLNDTYGDMFELGVIDPTKVVRLTLENANSVAGMFLTTKGIIAQSKEEKGYIDKLMTSSPQN